MRKFFSTIALILLAVMSLSAQSALVGTGGEAAGSGGSVSYSVGQIAVQSNDEGSTSISERGRTALRNRRSGRGQLPGHHAQRGGVPEPDAR